MKRLNKVLILLSSIFVSSSPQALADTWVNHPSFDNNPVRTVCTPNSTFFLVQQEYFKTTVAPYSHSTATIFYTSDNETIKPLNQRLKLSDQVVSTMDWSVKGEKLVVAYSNGCVDLIDKDFNISTVSLSKCSNTPGFHKINSISFDPATGNPWIATDGGYFVIDIANDEIITEKALNITIQAAFPMSNNIILQSNGKVYQSANQNPQSAKELTQIGAVGNNVLSILPGSDNYFIYTNGSANQWINVGYCKKEASAWITKLLFNKKLTAQTNEFITMNNYEMNLIPNRDGYLINTTTDINQIVVSPDRSVPTVLTMNCPEAKTALGSWDFNTFWHYSVRGNFTCVTPTHGDAVNNAITADWNVATTTIRPSAPTACIATHMSYSPEFGLVVNNHGHESQISNTSSVEPILTCSYKNGVWTPKAPTYYMPRSCENNADRLYTYNYYRNTFPMSNPRGLLIDPIMPNRAWMGSVFGGIACIDLEDPTNEVQRFASSADAQKIFPGFHDETPVDGWKPMSDFSAPMLDSENRLWSMYIRFSDAYGDGTKTVKLKYLTPEDRMKLYTTPEQISNPFWHSIEIEGSHEPDFGGNILPLLYGENKTKILLLPQMWGREVYIVDHRNTLEDSSDDILITLKGIRTPEGGNQDFQFANAVFESPETGEILFADYNGFYRFSPTAKVTDGYIDGEIVLPVSESGYSPASNVMGVYSLNMDSEGRLWIGTIRQGLICTDSSARKLYGEYNTTNSGIPSDRVYSTCWNPQTRSLMVSTLLGLAEFFPTSSATAPCHANEVSIYPSSITPDYAGVLSIRNVPQNSSVCVVDKDGREVARLATQTQTTIQWNLRDSRGNRVPSGLYKILIDGQSPITLPVLK